MLPDGAVVRSGCDQVYGLPAVADRARVLPQRRPAAAAVAGWTARMSLQRLASAAVTALALSGCAAVAVPLDEQQLAAQLAQRPVAVLGEVHDNRAQHRVRAAALRRLLEGGARPALAFEQFDRERQRDIDRARRETPAAGRSLAEHVVAQSRAPKDGWDWTQYLPFVELALQYDLPLVAANLSRADAGRVAREGLASTFDADELRALGLDRIDAELQAAHERIAQTAHCNLLPASALPGLARAQIARDAVLAQSLRPHLARGVILLTGNGHARRDLGLPRHLSAEERQRVWTIGLLEEGGAEPADIYDVAFVTPREPRPDPCERLRSRGG
jgi:uncharacterized iron-regulated protein